MNDKPISKIAVLGLGYVGLPLSLEFYKGGLEVYGIETDKEKVKKLNSGDSYLDDVPATMIKEAISSGRFNVVNDYKILQYVDSAIICVPTPLNKLQEPDISFIIQAVDSIEVYLHSGMLIVLESTTYPGTTEEVILPRLEKKGMRVGKDFYLAFSPERYDPGNKQYNIRNTPKVIGGVTHECTKKATELYKHAVSEIIPVSNARTAEMTKLLENTFRAVNIAMVNEMAMICNQLNIDIWEVIDSAKTKPFGFMPFYPGPGLGGHCIPIDPVYLSWKMKTLNYTARFIELARLINSSMPRYVVEKMADALNTKMKSIQGSKILLLGVTYKKDISDIRESPAVDIISLLLNKGAEIYFSDPFVKTIHVEGNVFTSYPLSNGLSQFDLVVIVTDHSSFDYQQIVSNSALILDTRNATKGLEKYSKGTIFKL
ncbi:MAG TPA: nucleotide sugar dehydrogenase [Candidatus Hydrogenedens sp.]|nr:nucleotide sugar dehydrogenase [Candidatus Hydrogenedens sp.]